jgi:Uma2 family endonuclease
MVPPPSEDHQAIGGRLFTLLMELCETKGLLVRYETGVWAADKDWRVPDMVVFPKSSRSDRGVDGPAHLVVEIRSPNDETDAKLAWYVTHGAAEILVIDPDSRTAQLFRPGDDGLPALAADTATAPLVLGVGVTLRTDAGDDGPELLAHAGDRTVSL